MEDVDKHAVLNNLPAGVVVLDSELETIQIVNDRFCELLGFDRSELLGDSVAAVEAGTPTQNRVRTQIESQVNQAEGREYVRLNWMVKTDQGNTLRMEGMISGFNDGGNVTIVVIQSESKELDDINASDEGIPKNLQARRILDYLSDYVLIVDKQGIIRFISPGVEDTLGHDPEKLMGIDAFEYVHPEDEPKTKAVFQEMLDNPAIETSHEYRVLTSDGTHRWIESRGSNYTDDPVIGGVLVAIRDITERKTYERRIETQNQILERLADIISHDLKTPVSTANKLKDILRRAHENPDRTIEEPLDRLEVVLDDLGAFADHLPTLAHQSTHVEEPIQCELTEVTQAAWQVVETEGLTLRVEDNCTLEGDPRRLQQVFQNLFENVRRHAPSATSVIVGTTPNGFYVEDDGPGIIAGADEDIFAYGTTSDAGTGAGLAIVQTIIEAHGWEITLAESGAAGACFEVYTDPK